MSSTSTKEQEKAKELYYKFEAHMATYEGDTEDAYKERIKQCALILCEEMLDQLGLCHAAFCGRVGVLEDYIPYEYWQSVKRHIQNL